MDAVGLDLMLPEYQERRQQALEEVQSKGSPPSVRNESTEPEVEKFREDTEQDRNEEEMRSGSTVPMNDVEAIVAVEQDRCEEGTGSDSSVPVCETNMSERVANAESDSQNSSIDSVRDKSSRGQASIYGPSVISPSINYDRDYPGQHLVAVFGREFDMPETVACSLQKLSAAHVSPPNHPSMKFVPFTLKRKTLLKGTFVNSELVNHDLICMCYNASEARILLTGTDGFYSSLLYHCESALGPNRVAFIITKYRPSSKNEGDTELICLPLKTRLANQEALVPYLDNDQILSWMYSPAAIHLDRLKELVQLEKNPRSRYYQPCVCL